jgi:hypothetical protein
VIRIVRTAARLHGAGWIAIMLRNLVQRGWEFDMVTCDISNGPQPGDEQLVVNLVGLASIPEAFLAAGADADGLASVYNFLQQQQRAETAISLVSGSHFTADVAGFVCECGAVGVVDSIYSAKRSANVVDRFFRSRPLSTLGPHLQQLPWSQFATKTNCD